LSRCDGAGSEQMAACGMAYGQRKSPPRAPARGEPTIMIVCGPWYHPAWQPRPREDAGWSAHFCRAQDVLCSGPAGCSPDALPHGNGRQPAETTGRPCRGARVRRSSRVAIRRTPLPDQRAASDARTTPGLHPPRLAPSAHDVLVPRDDVSLRPTVYAASAGGVKPTACGRTSSPSACFLHAKICAARPTPGAFRVRA
jgi:hypothetical protein